MSISSDAYHRIDFLKGFARTLFRRPGDAIAAAYWRITGRRVRARNRLRLAMAQLPDAYRIWIEKIERQSDTISAATDIIASWPVRPRLSVFPAESAKWRDRELEAMAASLKAQCYSDWELMIPDSRAEVISADDRIRSIGAPDANDEWDVAMTAATGDFVIPLRPGSILPHTALFRYVEALQNAPPADMLFGDEDEIDVRSERQRPWFKPLWNEEMALAQDYVSGACAIRTEAARRAHPITRGAGSVTPFALAFETAVGDTLGPVHVPHVQCHMTRAASHDDQSMRLEVVQRLLADRDAEVTPGTNGLLRVKWPLPTPTPLVSVIVPTRDKVGLLRNCVSGLLERTRYAPLEVIVVDNGSREPAALDYLAAIADNPLVRVIRDDGPFNFSRLNNTAALQARGDFLCLLNNDTEVLDGDWLNELVRQAVRPEVGAVGAKLLYDDDSIQHAGVVVGMGDAAGHAHRFQRPGEPGYFYRADIPHFVTAVTAACLLVHKNKFDAVGGFDEEHLAVAFNDVDLCLKLERRGWRNVYQPRAVLLHHESKSRGKDISPQHIDRYRRELHVLQTRWSTSGRVDPLHHPMLDRSSESYLLRL